MVRQLAPVSFGWNMLRASLWTEAIGDIGGNPAGHQVAAVGEFVIEAAVAVVSAGWTLSVPHCRTGRARGERVASGWRRAAYRECARRTP
jgi:hypothetical protein